MKTRLDTLQEFSTGMDVLVKQDFMMCGTEMFNVLVTINTSKLLRDIVTHFTMKYDFKEDLEKRKIQSDTKTYLYFPTSDQDIIAFTYSFMTETTSKTLQLLDFLKLMDGGSNCNKEFSILVNKLFIPFKNSLLKIAKIIIAEAEGTNVSGQDTNNESKNKNAATFDDSAFVGEQGESVINVEQEENDVETEKEEVVLDQAAIERRTKLLRNIELDKLAVSQSRIKQDEKDELDFVLDVLKNKIEDGDTEKIRLAYYCYYYAFKPYKKVSINIKTITATLQEEGII